MSNYKWEVKESEEFLLIEASPFVDDLFFEICEKYDKLSLLSAGSLTEGSQKRFLDVIVVFIVEKLMETLSNIKKVI